MNNFITGFAVAAIIAAIGIAFWPEPDSIIPDTLAQYERQLSELEVRADSSAKNAEYWQGMAMMYANNADSLASIPRTKHLTDAIRDLRSADLDSLTRVLFADPTH